MKTRLSLIVTLLSIWMSGMGQSIDKLLLSYNNTTDSITRLELEQRLAWAYQDQHAYNRALEFYKKVLSTELDTLQSQKIRASMAFCYGELRDYVSEISTREDIVRFDSKNKSNTISNLLVLSSLYEKTGQREKAIQTNNKLLKEAEQSKDYVSMTKAYNNLGYLYKLNKDAQKSSEYFDKSYSLATKGIGLKTEDRVTIITNLGVMSASIGEFDQAQKYFNEALGVTRVDNVPLKVAKAINYKATGYYLRNDVTGAVGIMEEALNILSQIPVNEESDAVRADCYKLMTELMMKSDNMAQFKIYQKKYDDIQEKALQLEKSRNRLFMERQLLIDRQEREIQTIINESEKNKVKLIQSELATVQKQKELDSRLNELARLRDEHELQTAQLKNQQLERQKINQLLEISNQKATAAEQKRKIDELQHDKDVQDLSLAKTRKEIELMENTRQQEAKIKEYSFIIIGLLLVLLGASGWLYILRNRKNMMLAAQNLVINNMNKQMMETNEELSLMNETLHERSLEVESKNQKLEHAQDLIHEQHVKLLSYSKNLEGEIEKRIKEIKDTNRELIRYNAQLEQFAFTVSHNLRGPIARLLGLTDLIKISSEAERNLILAKIEQSSKDLDGIIHDLTSILDIKSGLQKVISQVDIEEQLEKVIVRLDNVIRESNVEIKVDINEGKTIHAVSSYIDSVLYNLLSNAIKYRSTTRPCIITVSTHLKDNMVVLCVSDNGTGIDLVKYGHQLFGLYRRFNTSIEGKGLGLYLVKAQVESLNGHIEVESKINAGTTFRVFLPRSFEATTTTEGAVNNVVKS